MARFSVDLVDDEDASDDVVDDHHDDNEVHDDDHQNLLRRGRSLITAPRRRFWFHDKHYSDSPPHDSTTTTTTTTTSGETAEAMHAHAAAAPYVIYYAAQQQQQQQQHPLDVVDVAHQQQHHNGRHNHHHDPMIHHPALYLIPQQQQQQQQHPRPSLFHWRGFCWRLSLFILLLAHIVALYGPPAPPPLQQRQHDDDDNNAATTTVITNWNDFVRHHSHMLLTSLSALGSCIPHVARWCWRGIKDDVTEWLMMDSYHHTTTIPKTSSSSCCELLSFSNYYLEDLNFVGQPRAVSVVQETLAAWTNVPYDNNNNNREHDDDQSSVSSSLPKSRLLLLVGTLGVGKMELARQLAKQLVVAEATSSTEEKKQEEDDCILEFDNNDNINNEWNAQQKQEQHQQSVTDKIRQQLGLLDTTSSSSTHRGRCRRHGRRPSVVILRHVDKLVSSSSLSSQQESLVALLRDLHSTRGLLVLMTTHVGASTIHKHLKRHGGAGTRLQDVPPLELDLSLRDAWDEAVGVDDASQYIHAFVPFAPLQREDLQAIVEDKIQQMWNALWSARSSSSGTPPPQLQTIGALSRALVDERHIEYIEWRDRRTQEQILVFAGTGAKALEEGQALSNKLVAHLQPCLKELLAAAATTAEQQHHADSDHHHVAVLNLVNGKGTASWCVSLPQDANVYPDCRLSCQFSVD